MARLEEDNFTLARRILANIDETTDPAKRIQEFETGIDLLGKYVGWYDPFTPHCFGDLSLIPDKNLGGNQG